MAPADIPSKPPAKNPKTLKRFKFFTKLPNEIRIMIWTLCLPGPRVVDVRIRRKSIPTLTGEILDVGRFVSSVDHPVHLHVCSESRQLARQHYKLSFPKKTNTEWSPAQIYIDFSIDTIWFDNLRYFPSVPFPNSPKSIPKAEFTKIKHLAMRHDVDRLVLDCTKLFNPKYFPALETIYMVDTELQPHPVVLDVGHLCDSKDLAKVWEKEKRCPVAYFTKVNKIPELSQKFI